MNFRSFFHSFFFIFLFFKQSTVLSSRTVDGHRMYSEGSVVGKASRLLVRPEHSGAKTETETSLVNSVAYTKVQQIGMLL